MLKEELITVLLELFKNTEGRGTLPNSFCEAGITLILMSDKKLTRKENIDQQLYD